MATRGLTLQGIRAPISDGDEFFVPFFNLVQKTAAEQNKVFFLDAGEGRDFETADMEGEDLSGWLIEKSQITVFEPQWLEGWDAIDDSFSDDFVMAKWHLDGDKVSGRFVKTL